MPFLFLNEVLYGRTARLAFPFLEMHNATDDLLNCTDWNLLHIVDRRFGVHQGAALQLPRTSPSSPLLARPPRAAGKLFVSASSEGDENTAGIRPTGKPWTLADLIIDSSMNYASEKLKSGDIVLARLSVAASVKPEPQSISLAGLCNRAGHPVETKNQSVDEPLAAVGAVASLLGEVAARPTPNPQPTPH